VRMSQTTAAKLSTEFAKNLGANAVTVLESRDYYWHQGAQLEVVVGTAPGWADPWARARRVSVQCGEHGWPVRIVDETGRVLDDDEIQRARLAGPD